MLLCSDGLSVQCHLSLFCRKERGCQKQHCEGGNYVALPLPVSLGLALKLGLCPMAGLPTKGRTVTL